MRRTALAVVGLLLLAGTAAAADPKDPQKRHTAADMRLARSIALKGSDLQPGWKADAGGGAGSSATCSVQPDESRLVETADVDPSFTYKDKLTNIGSEVQLFRTAAQARADWRAITLAALRTCAVEALRQELGKGSKVTLTQARTVPISSPAERAFHYRFSITIRTGTRSLPVVMEFTGIGKGRASVFFHVVSFGAAPPASFLTPFLRLFAGRLNAAPSL